MRKLTVIGVLAALVLGVVGLAQTASAFIPSNVQSFCTGTTSGPCTGANSPIDWTICYAPPNTATAIGGYSITLPADLTGKVTVTAAANGLTDKDRVTITGTAGINGSWIASDVLAGSFTIRATGIVVPGGAGGTVLGSVAPQNGSLGCHTGSSDTNIPLARAGLQIDSYQVIKVPQGSRLTLPITYSPVDWGDVGAAVLAPTGDVTAATGVLCNGDVDILADNGTPGAPSAAAGAGPYPAGDWDPAVFIRQTLVLGVPVTPDPFTLSDNGYIDQIKPMPSTFADFSVDRSNLRRIWLGGSISYDIPTAHYVGDIPAPTLAQLANAGTPLINLTTTSPYVAGLKVSVALLGGQPDPPTNGFLCLDSPQSSVAKNTQLIAPAAGEHIRWTVFQSAADLVDGTVTRLFDTQCVNVGTGPCTVTNITADADGDLVPDAVEAITGTSTVPVTGVDTDGDGSSDFDEMVQFTNPLATDTDGDLSRDAQDNLAGFNCVSVAGVCTVANLGDLPATGVGSDDNCPVDFNPSQANSDSQVDFTNSPNTPAGAIYRGDATNPHQDSQGDACDSDDDNDGLADVVEPSWNHVNVQPGCTGAGTPIAACAAAGPAAGSLYCLSANGTAPVGGQTLKASDPLNPDSDSDGGLDGRECTFGSDPLSAIQASCSPNCAVAGRFPDPIADPDGDLLYPDGAEVFYRSTHIQLVGALLDDLESLDAAVTANAVCNDPNATPLRCDNKSDPTVLQFIPGNPADNDSDGDLLNDGVEVKWYGTSPGNYDTDGDGCSDGKEAGDVNGDHKSDSTDALAISQHTTTGSLAPGGARPYPLGTTGAPAATTLAVGISATDTSLDVTLATGLTSYGKVLIGTEVIVYTGISGSTLTGLVRGAGTTAAAHLAGVAVTNQETAYFVGGVRRDELATYDINKDGKIDSTDSSVRAKINGNCKAGTGAQTGKLPTHASTIP